MEQTIWFMHKNRLTHCTCSSLFSLNVNKVYFLVVVDKQLAALTVVAVIFCHWFKEHLISITILVRMSIHRKWGWDSSQNGRFKCHLQCFPVHVAGKTGHSLFVEKLMSQNALNDAVDRPTYSGTMLLLLLLPLMLMQWWATWSTLERRASSN